MKGDGAGGTRVRLRAAWRRPRRLHLRRPGGPAARRSACVLHAVAMFVQQQVAVVVACVWRVPAVVCVREELLLLERAIAAPVLSPSARTLRSRFNSQRALHRSAVLLLHTAVLFPPTAAPRLHFFSKLLYFGLCCKHLRSFLICVVSVRRMSRGPKDTQKSYMHDTQTAQRC